jgi:Secretion system C-terminal sorting domain
MKNRFLLSAIFLLLLVGLYSPASYSAQSFNIWGINCTFTPGCTSYSFDFYIQNTGDPLTVYSFQFGWSIVASASNGGTLTGAWSGVNPLITLTNGGSPKAPSFATAGYIKGGWNVSAGGSGSGVVIPSTPFKIATFTINNTVPFTGYPCVTWYFGGAPGLKTVVNATNGSTVYDVTSLGTYSYVVPMGDCLWPVELSSFVTNVQGRNIILNWETKTEKNSDKFIVERKTINSDWESIGSVKAADLSNSPKQYSYTDNKLQQGKYQYRLKLIDNDGSFNYSTVVEAEVSVPKNFELSQNFPNPFNPSTKINYSLPFDSKVTLEVYNITGARVNQLVNEEQLAGYYSVDFGASNLSSGVYFYRISAVDKATGNNFSSIKKMMLLK